jgi:PKD repeat protein
VAALTATPNQAYTPQVVALNASGSTDNDATPISAYSFDCGNGQKTGWQASATTSCNFTKAGNYNASVQVRDTAGLVSTKVNANVKILADVAPNAALTVSNTKPAKGQTITADASGSTSVDKSPIATYRFDCGNGQTTGQQVSATTTCTYPTAGNYTVKVFVTDTVGLVGTANVKIQVK